ncbi:MAG: hypothetical protein AAB628_01840 [Patescibacteria group bacterium]
MKLVLPLAIDALINSHRDDTLAFAKKFEESHGETFMDNLAKQLGVPVERLVDDTPSNLKELMEIPGAFFNKRRRPIPLGVEN